MDQVRVDAVIMELKLLIDTLTQRNINLAGDLAVALKELQDLKTPKGD